MIPRQRANGKEEIFEMLRGDGFFGGSRQSRISRVPGVSKDEIKFFSKLRCSHRSLKRLFKRFRTSRLG